MEDSVGPLLMTASLLERLQAGDDTMTVTFSEPVDYQKLPGQTLTLIKEGQPFQLTVKNALPGENGAVIITTDNTLSEGVAVSGDSLMITAPSTLTDNNGNRAHPQNRPVPVRLRAICPSLTSAEYRDDNGDGIIETVRARFNKSADIEFLLLTVNFDGMMSANMVPPDNMTFIDGTEKTEIDFRMDDLFPFSFLRDKTSGTILITARFANFPENSTSSVVAEDKAAPVLVALEYHYGAAIHNRPDTAADTIYAKFSETLQSSPQVEVPFRFISESGDPYLVPVAAVEGSYSSNGYGLFNGYYRFIVSEKLVTVEGGTQRIDNSVANAKDSAWINSDHFQDIAVVDMNGNAQTNPENKKVAIVVKDPSELSPEDSLRINNQKEPVNGACGGCGPGILLAFIPPMFFYTRQRVRKKK